MLTKVKGWLAYHAQAAKASLQALCRQPMASFMTILAIAITLVLPALFWVFTDNMAQLTKNWQQGGHIALYLQSSLPEQEETQVLLQVREIPGVGHATLKSSAEELAELQKQEGMEDMMQYLPENPLPAVIDVVPSPEMNTPEAIEQLFSQLKTIQHVEQAKLDMQWINRLHAILKFVDTLAHGLMMLLALAVVLIIGNTLRLAIQSRYEEIQVLKLIGARDSYIVRPFLYSGVWYGLGGAIIAVLLVNIFLISLTMVVNELASVYQMHYFLVGLSTRQVTLLVFSAILLGWLGARLTVKKQLMVIEP